MFIYVILFVAIACAIVEFFAQQQQKKEIQKIKIVNSKNAEYEAAARRKIQESINQAQLEAQNQKLVLAQEIQKQQISRDTLENLVKNLNHQIENEKLRAEKEYEVRARQLDGEFGERKAQLEQQYQKRVEELEKSFNQKLVETNEELDEFLRQVDDTKDTMVVELDEVLKEIMTARQQRNTINEARRKEEEILNDNTYSIELSSQAKSDIEFLFSIEHHLSNPEILRKLIWSEYLQEPFNEMIKRQFGSTIPKNIVYCIMEKDSHKVYIGKTAVTAKDRWTEHIKSSLGIGKNLTQLIHKALLNNWDGFTFQVLEVVDKDTKLTDRESYYIAFYESDKYGFNMKG